MNRESPTEVTRLLAELGRDAPASEVMQRLYPLLETEIRQIARRLMGREGPDATLQPTELAHELYHYLAGRRRLSIKNRSHFLAVACRTMRRILVCHARRRKAEKRGGGWLRVSLVESLIGNDSEICWLVDLDRALSRLEKDDSRAARVAELRLFFGMLEREIARGLEITSRTVQEDWRYARLWLKREMGRGIAPDASGDGPVVPLTE
ncbi:MAG: ECF-type sigma factor [Candidatus Eisenbacteria bacterium]|uniref:RNA polymerase subunit sigma-70 n=1 Tax=Eiseniibacteriota bacterium TaxID=2212470 RepID=A0A956LX66_UNCEI|nr:RNA polymerase subunit sigma-70 [Candidatus Eisenbacteria bacterium]